MSTVKPSVEASRVLPDLKTDATAVMGRRAMRIYRTLLDYETRITDSLDAMVTFKTTDKSKEELRRDVIARVTSSGLPLNVDKILAGRGREGIPALLLRDIDHLGAFADNHPGDSAYATRDLTLKLYLKLGAVLFSAGLRDLAEDPVKASANVQAVLMFIEHFGRIPHAGLAYDLTDSLLCVLDSWLGGWFCTGCPRVRLSREEASALALSNMPDAFVDDENPIQAPWTQFLIDIPPGVLLVPDEAGNQLEVDRIMMHRMSVGRCASTVPPELCDDGDGNERADIWVTMIGCGAEVISAPNGCTEATDFFEQHGFPSGLFSRSSKKPVTAAMLPGLGAAARIAAGVCFALENMKREGKLRLKSAPPSRVKGPPQTTDYRLGLPITVDFTAALNDHTLGRVAIARKSQWVVRGHWRDQACGIALAERRRTWIAPYWKGPAHLPILVRTHDLSFPRRPGPDGT